MPVCIVSPYLRDLRHCKHSRTELTSQIYKQIFNLANNMRNKSEQNLIPMNKQPPEVQRELSRKGGRNSGKSCREKRAMADVLRMMIEQPIPANQRNAVQALKKLGISSADATKELFVFDEFTSVVDRNVAKIGSLAMQKAIRQSNNKKQFIAVTCHFDVIEWLQPDWIFNTNDMTFSLSSKKKTKHHFINIRNTNSTRQAEILENV